MSHRRLHTPRTPRAFWMLVLWLYVVYIAFGLLMLLVEWVDRAAR